MNQNNYCIIMAGGVGSRFWPLSKNEKPKQFLDILGIGKTLLQQTFERFQNICRTENILIVTNERYAKIVKEQLPGINSEQLLLEPMRRNTAPCIAYANAKIFMKNPNANIVVAPSDHLIQNVPEFLSVITEGLDYVKDKDIMLTLGIKPNRPETGYGYIQIEKGKQNIVAHNIRKVKTFTEKPNLEMAEVFYKSGEFYWNSGIFLWSINTINKAMQRHLPEIFSLFENGTNKYNTEAEAEFIRKTYSECRNISIDYGLMERADNVHVYGADFGWSDLGTWGSLYENLHKQTNGNALICKNILTYDTKNCIVNIPNDKLVVIHGLEDYLVVESEGILLICKKDSEKQIRQIVNDVKAEFGEIYT